MTPFLATVDEGSTPPPPPFIRRIMKKIIHVNQHKIKSNTKNKTDEPVLTVKTYKDNTYAHEAILKTKDGSVIGRVIYSPHKPLSCGARVWIEVDTEVVEVETVVRDNND